jgi:dTDP-4-dehydrorhamnose 3,5-epimerase
MEVVELSIPEVKLIKPKRFGDVRGFFQQTYHQEEYREHGIDVQFVQDNWSRSSKGVLRGLHYQLQNPQAKLVSVQQGEVYDVAVDMRQSSETFGRWVGAVLSEENGHQLYVPEGFAHGFLVLSDTADFMYKCGALYAPNDEYGVIWNDEDLGIEWPAVEGFKISDKDAKLPNFKDAVNLYNWHFWRLLLI